MRKNSIYLIVFALVVAFGVWLFFVLRAPAVTSFEECVEAGYPVMESYPRQCAGPDGTTFTEIIDPSERPDNDTRTPQATYRDLLRVKTPVPQTPVSSPLSVRGDARGTWFFEASFPVRLIGPDGSVLAEAPAQAQDEWMTEEYVPFAADLVFSAPQATGTGELVFEKANPSGLPEHADQFSIPISFAERADGQTLQIYFNRDEQTSDCAYVEAVPRTIPDTPGVARAALLELLKGPTAGERDARYLSSIPPSVTLNSIRIEDGVAYVDFSEEMNTAAGSCRVQAIRAQIEATLMQFPTVQSVVISVAGEVDTALQP